MRAKCYSREDKSFYAKSASKYLHSPTDLVYAVMLSSDKNNHKNIEGKYRVGSLTLLGPVRAILWR